MKNAEKTKFVQDVPSQQGEYVARKPFKVQTENRRRFIRLEIGTPMSLKKIRDGAGHFWAEGDWHMISGMILNMSAGGVLVELDQPIDEGDVVTMQFSLQGVEVLDNVLGLVKRVDAETDYWITGIEFVSRQHLQDHFSKGEMEMLGSMHTNFSDSVSNVLGKYIQAEIPAEGAGNNA